MSSAASPFSSDASLFILEDVGIVFSERAQKIYELNATATWLWCQLEDGVPLEALPRALADTFGFSEASARRHLADSLSAWRNLGFLAAAGDEPGVAQAAARPGAQALRRSLPKDLVLGLRQSRLAGGGRVVEAYRSLGQATVVVYPTAELVELIHPAISHVALDHRVLAPQSLVEILPHDAGFDVKRDGKIKYRNVRREQLTPVVQYLVQLAAIERSRYTVAFHAGAIAAGDRIAVLPGNAGNGKTTLTAALLREGFRYLSDDLLLMGSDLKIEGVPFALGIKDSGVAPLLPYYPDLPSLTLHHRADGKKLRYLSAPLTADSPDRPPLRLPASWVIFPRYRADGTTAYTPLRKGEALRRLMESSTLALPLNRLQIETFIRWLEALDCYDLQVNALDEAVAAVKSIISGRREEFET